MLELGKTYKIRVTFTNVADIRLLQKNETLHFYDVNDFNVNGTQTQGYPNDETLISIGDDGGVPDDSIIVDNYLNHFVLTNVGEYIEFYGTLTTKLDSDSYYDELVEKGILRYIAVTDTLTLYRLKGKRNIVNKYTYLTLVGSMDGTFKDMIDISNPILTIEYNSVPDFNYVYIPSLKRYYFVNDVICVRNKIYEIHLHVDVLYTYKTDIASQYGYIDRTSGSSSSEIVDERLPLKDVKSVSIEDISTYATPIATNITNVTFDQSDIATGRHFLLDCMNLIDTIVYTDLTPPTNTSGFSTIAGSRAIQNSLYLLNKDVVGYLISAIKTESALASYVNSVTYYPFSLSALNDNTIANNSVIINDKYLQVDGTFSPSSTGSNAGAPRMTHSYMQYIIIADFMVTPSFSGYQSFLNYSPFTKYELYIPFVQWVELNGKDILNNRIVVYYACDVSSGLATCFVKNYVTGQILYSTSCSIGIKIPINTTNADIITREKQNATLNMIMGLTSSAIQLGVGIGTGNPLQAVKGGIGIANAIVKDVNANNMMIERASCSAGSVDTFLYDVLGKVLLRKTYPSVVAGFDATTFVGENGYKVKTYGALSGLSGYTEISKMHYVPSSTSAITMNEISEIENLARDGIIL